MEQDKAIISVATVIQIKEKALGICIFRQIVRRKEEALGIRILKQFLGCQETTVIPDQNSVWEFELILTFKKNRLFCFSLETEIV